jgi:hypothetical protein
MDAVEAPQTVWRESDPVPTYSIYRTVGPVMIDGAVDEQCWQLAPILRLSCDLHTQRRTETGAAWWMAVWSEDTLYVAYVCPDANGVVAASAGEKGGLIKGDAVELFVDPTGGGKLFHEFHANAAGKQTNQVVSRETDKGTAKKDPAGELAFLRECNLREVEVAGTVLREGDKIVGYTVEMAIPLGPQGLGMFAGWPQEAPGPEDGETVRLYPVRVEHTQAATEDQRALFVVASPTFSKWNHVPERWCKATFAIDTPEGWKPEPRPERFTELMELSKEAKTTTFPAGTGPKERDS